MSLGDSERTGLIARLCRGVTLLKGPIRLVTTRFVAVTVQLSKERYRTRMRLRWDLGFWPYGSHVKHWHEYR